MAQEIHLQKIRSIVEIIQCETARHITGNYGGKPGERPDAFKV